MAANIAFATFYYVNRGSFEGLEAGSFLNALYFGFITFTTVGYGDITPATTLSQSASGKQVELLFGESLAHEAGQTNVDMRLGVIGPLCIVAG